MKNAYIPLLIFLIGFVAALSLPGACYENQHRSLLHIPPSTSGARYVNRTDSFVGMFTSGVGNDTDAHVARGTYTGKLHEKLSGLTFAVHFLEGRSAATWNCLADGAAGLSCGWLLVDRSAPIWSSTLTGRDHFARVECNE